VALAPIYGLLAVSVGGGFAHCMCILVAMAFGKTAMLIISENTLLMVGGVLFIIFGIIEMILELI
jgi:putative Ca2+/H+ antiporter (TMEM165/GDT1 family)